MHYQIVALSCYRAGVTIFIQGHNLDAYWTALNSKFLPNVEMLLIGSSGRGKQGIQKKIQGESCCTRNNYLHTTHSRPPKNMPKEPQLSRKP